MFLFTILTIVVNSRFYDINQSQSLFDQFKKDYEKVYENSLTELNKFRIFSQNLENINKLNQQHDDSVEFGITEFSDMTQEEFKNQVLLPSQEGPIHNSDRYTQSNSQIELPKSFDWRDSKAVSSVKNQGAIGTCWAFSAVGNIESQNFLTNKQMTDFSVEQLVECDATIDPNNERRADCGMWGGWPYLAMDYIIKAGGLATEQDYPYCIKATGAAHCLPCTAEGFDSKRCGRAPLTPPSCKIVNPCKKDIKKGVIVNDWKAVDGSDETKLAQQLIELGPLSVALDAMSLQFYHWGVFDPIVGCSKTTLNHAVLMVGFGTDKKDYWIIKNSWGEKWGEKGYFRIRRNAGTCGINTQVITAIVQQKEIVQ